MDLRIHYFRLKATAIFVATLLPLVGLCQTANEDTKRRSLQQPVADIPTLPDWLKDAPNARVEHVPERIFSGNMVLYRAGQPGAHAVLLIHGIGQAGAEDWKYLIPALSADHDVFAVDLPGFGKSPKGNHLYSPDNYVKLIKIALARNIDRPFILIGHSMGAAVALAFAHRYPADVHRLILVDIAGILHRTVYAESLGRAWIRKRAGGNGASAWLESFMTSMLRQIDGMSLDNSLVLNFASMRNRFFDGDPSRIAGFAMVEHNFSAALRGIVTPTLIIWGEDDEVAPLRTGQLTASTIRDARLRIIESAGHTPQLERPEEFNAIVVAELRGELRLPVYATSAAASSGTDTIANCSGESDQQFSGEFRRITLDNCTNAQISGAKIGKLDVSNSTVNLVNSHVSEGVTAAHSHLTITGGSVSGEVSFVLEATDIDAAGTRLSPSRKLAINTGDTPITLQLSVVEFVQSEKSKFLHQLLLLEPEAKRD